MGTKVKRSRILKLCVLAVLLSISLIFVNFSAWAIEPRTSLTDPQTGEDDKGNTWIYTLVDENNKTEGNSNNFQCVKINSLEKVENKNNVLEIPSEINHKKVISVGNGQSNILQKLESKESSNVTITDVKFPESVKFINDNAFSSLTTLTSITGWDNVTQIGENAFNGCDGLTEIRLPEDLVTLGKSAFSNCDGLTKLDFDDHLEIIGDFAFANCTELTGSLTFPEPVKTIGDSAFRNCKEICGNITFEGQKLISIGDYAFQNCINVNKIILPKSIDSVGTSAFNGLKDVWIDANEGECRKELSSSCFGECDGFVHYNDEKIKVKAQALEGIQIIDNTTGNDFVSGDYDCEQKIDLKFVVKNRETYNNLKLYIAREADFKHEEKVYDEIDFENGEASYTIEKLLRDYEFLTLDITDNLDLSVRTYLDEHDGKALDTPRCPQYELNNCEITYKHTKQPVTVKTGDTLKYKIQVFNEGKQDAYAKKVLEYLPEGLEFKKDSKINKQYGWTPVKDNSRVYSTDYLKDTKINGYNPYKDIDSKELEIECIVTAEKGTEINRLTNFAEIKESCTADDDTCVNDFDSVGGNLDIEDYSNYKYEESKASNADSFIKSEEDDTDFENVVVLRDVPVSYTIKISKIDLEDYKLLNGAKFDLMNEDGQVIQSKVTVENGVLEFDQITTYGSGKDIYYINEVESPEGYIDSFGQVIKITVIKEVKEEEIESYTLKVICEVLETKIDTRIDENSLIPIYTKEQLEKVGSGDEVTIDDITYKLTKTNNYRLMNDIDISGKEWKPLPSIEGIFDGNGHKITGLKITDSSKIEVTKDKKEKTEALEEGEEEETEETEKESINIGLFGEFSGIIKNLELDDVEINIELHNDDKKELEELEKKYNDPKNNSEKTKILEEMNQLLSKYHIGGFVGKMKGGSIKASSIDGTIETSSNNVGGFAGYAEKGYLTKITDSTNNATIETEQSNAGGFIGYSYSALSLVNCTNNGEVKAGKYNSAGLVGCSEATDYKRDDRTVNYDETNHIIDLALGNSKYTGKYSLKLEKIDNLTKELIDGTHFTIYNADKKAINKLENVEVENGVLDIGTFEIKATGVDTYFIKEVSTIDGYDLIKDYIKINVVKTWDGKQGDFKVHLDSFNVDTEKFEQSTDTSAKEPTSKTDGNYDITGKGEDEVSWLVNKVVATECKNTANITAKVNASGIFAKTKCIVDIEKSTNSGKITAKNHSAGLLSEALKVENKDENTNIIINECSNSGNIVIEKVDLGDTDIGTGSANTAGILADTEVFTIVKGTNNSGKVSGPAQTLGGIVANAKNSIVVDKCNNTANVEVDTTGSISSDYVAGIVARNLIAGTTIDITNSTNTGNITSSQSAAGILGTSAADKIRIADCNTSDCKIDGSGNVSGILAFSVGNTYINRCNTPNIHLNINNGNSSYSIGAIVGIICNISSVRDLNGISKECSPVVIDIEDCKIQKMQQTGSVDEVGGVVGKIINTKAIDTIKFKNCKIEDSEIKMQRFSKAGMLYANALYYKTLDVDNCDVISSTISSSSGCSEGSMLMGFSGSTSSTDKGLYTNVNDCDIISSHFNVSGGSNFGNIISYLTGNGGKNSITISNCNVNDSKMNTSNASLIGNIAGALYEMNDIVFTDCEINNSPIDLQQGRQDFISSCIGMTKANNLNVKNIDVTDSSIKSQRGTGGILIAGLSKTGYSSNNKVTFENCNLIDNSMIIGNPNSYNSTNNVGFLMGYNQLDTANIKNIVVKGEKEKQKVFGSQTGIIGYTEKDANIDNLTLDNYTYSYNGSSKIAGVVGMISYSNLNLKNSKITNLDFEAQSGSAICNSCTKKVTVDNVEVENIKVSSTSGYDAIGGLVSYTSGGLDLTNSKINNIDIKTNENGTNNIVSGIVAYSGGESTISNNNVTNINVENKNRSQNQYTVAGIIGIQNSNLTYNNNNNSDFTLIGDNNVAGIVGILPGTMSTSVEDNSKNYISKFYLESKGENNGNCAVAGVIGIGTQLTKINNIEVNDIDLKSSSYLARIGGIAGTAYLELKDCNVTDINIQNPHKNTSIPAMSSSCMGGIAGVNAYSSTDSSSSNLNVEEANITGTAGYVGGIYGCSSDNVTDSSFITGEILLTGDICAGGIYGVSGNRNANMSDLTVEYVNMSSDKGCIGGICGKSMSGISNAHVQNANITFNNEESISGGIVGFDCNNITISDSDVYFSTITNVSKQPQNKEAKGVPIYPTGGIVGFSSGTIENCDIYDSEIKSTGSNAYATGGIVGHGYNYSGSVNEKIFTKVKECNVIGCTITGNDGVGGIAGVAVPKIENCNVELTTAQTTKAQSVEPVVKIESNVDENVNQNQETVPVQPNILAEQNVAGNISIENSKSQEYSKSQESSKSQEDSKPQENDITNNPILSEETSTKEKETEEGKSPEEKDEAEKSKDEKAKEENKSLNNLEQNQESSNTEIKIEVDENAKSDESVVLNEVESELKTNETPMEDSENEEKDTSNENDENKIMLENISVETENSIDEVKVSEKEIDTEIIQSDVITENSETIEDDKNSVGSTEQTSEDATQDSTQNVQDNSKEDPIDDITEEKTEDKEDEMVEDSNENESNTILENNENDVTSEKGSQIDEEEISDEASKEESSENTESVQEPQEVEQKVEMIPQSTIVDNFIKNDNLLNATTSSIESIVPNTFVEVVAQEEKESEVKGKMCVGGIIGCGGILFTPYMFPLDLDNCTVSDTIVSGDTNVEEIVGKKSEISSNISNNLSEEQKNKLKDDIYNCNGDNCELISPQKQQEP